MSSSSSSFALAAENIYYIGITLQDILYGIEIVLYFNTIHILLGRRSRQLRDLFYVVFSTVVFLLVTISVVTNAVHGQKMWVFHGDDPIAYGEAHLRDAYMFLGSVAVIILQQIIDGLMIYRSYVLWNNYRVIIVSCILWVTILALGISVCWASQIPGSYLILGVEFQLGLAYFVFSVVLNLTSTCLICFRLVTHARAMKKNLGAEYASPYFNIIILVVESALPLTLCGIGVVISSGMGSPTAIAFSRVYALMMSISPQMLILRVAEGKAWSNESLMGPGSMIKFASDDSSGSNPDSVTPCFPSDSLGLVSLGGIRSRSGNGDNIVGMRTTKI